jgi:protein-S-isoprenylcysteine O-methyltransferase Ste14
MILFLKNLLFTVLIPLRRLFGAEYEEYCRSVRRWIPTLPRNGK